MTGRNGSGKSSLLRLIAGLLRADAGRISLKGGNTEASIGEQAHYLGHQDALKPSLTVQENLRFWSAYLGPAENPPERALERARPKRAGRPARRLSLGRPKAAAVARPADHRAPPALAARRAGFHSRCRRPSPPRRSDAASSDARGPDPCRGAWRYRPGRRAGDQTLARAVSLPHGSRACPGSA